MERADPIFTCSRPSVPDLTLGTLLRLYTRTNSRFVAEGTLVSHGSGEKWNGTKVVVGVGRAVVKLTKIQVGAALMLFPDENGGALRRLRDAHVGEQVLWDVVSQTATNGESHQLGTVSIGDHERQRLPLKRSTISASRWFLVLTTSTYST